jgi:hypothetical protein
MMRVVVLAFLTAVTVGCGRSPQATPVLPQPPFDLNTYEGVVADVLTNLDEESKGLLKKIAKRDLLLFHLSWGMGIRNKYGFWRNEALVTSCGKQRGHQETIHPDDASLIVMEGVWDVVNSPN